MVSILKPDAEGLRANFLGLARCRDRFLKHIGARSYVACPSILLFLFGFLLRWLARCYYSLKNNDYLNGAPNPCANMN
jgi:hypothetical protein